MFQTAPAKSIILLTDFSKCAQNAGAYALVQAEKFLANILLVNSYFIPLSGFDTWPSQDYPSLKNKSIERLEQEAERLKSLLQKTHKEFCPVIECISEGGELGDIVRMLIEQRKDVLMVVLGGYRARNNDEFAFGTVIAEILAKAKCPAVVVPELEFPI